jgi:hypothetical protein
VRCCQLRRPSALPLQASLPINVRAPLRHKIV